MPGPSRGNAPPGFQEQNVQNIIPVRQLGPVGQFPHANMQHNQVQGQIPIHPQPGSPMHNSGPNLPLQGVQIHNAMLAHNNNQAPSPLMPQMHENLQGQMPPSPHQGNNNQNHPLSPENQNMPTLVSQVSMHDNTRHFGHTSPLRANCDTFRTPLQSPSHPGFEPNPNDFPPLNPMDINPTLHTSDIEMNTVENDQGGNRVNPSQEMDTSNEDIPEERSSEGSKPARPKRQARNKS